MNPENRVTESASNHSDLDKMSVSEIVSAINQEDYSVARSVEKSLPQITMLAEQAAQAVLRGGRIFYIGAGTSGRLGIVDASECPPTFGVPHGIVVGLMAGGDSAMRKAVEFAEDDEMLGWNDLQEYMISDRDILIGIAASGTTPYVIGAVTEARKNGIVTGCITCNPDSPLAQSSEFPVEVVTGPEFVTGSTRMKAGTAQKMVLNMISTSAMIRFGRVKGNRMVDMQLSNEKLIDRGTRMVMEELKIDSDQAKQLLLEHGSVRGAIESQNNE
jgi:N-acetylmuramic acid 6-phosphate etherase